MTPCWSIVFIGALVAVAYNFMINTEPTVETCAESCSCTVDTDWSPAVNVQCGERNLTKVPIKIKDKQASILNVSFNDLKILKKNALLSYKSVRELYFQKCNLINVNEKAFQGLENLTVIDLSYNHLHSISPKLFIGNHLLDRLILQNNDLRALQGNTSILNGPPSLSFLDLQSCKLSTISSRTFSSLPNLKVLDISRNELVLLNHDTLSSHQQLEDVILEGNLLKCGHVFKDLLCWMHSKLAGSHNRTMKCLDKNGAWNRWAPQNRSSLCDPVTTPSVISSYKPGISNSTTLNPAVTPSNKPGISTSTTRNPAISLQPESNAPSTWQWILLIVVLLIIGFVCGYVFKKYVTQCGKYKRLQPHVDNGRENASL